MNVLLKSNLLKFMPLVLFDDIYWFLISCLKSYKEKLPQNSKRTDWFTIMEMINMFLKTSLSALWFGNFCVVICLLLFFFYEILVIDNRYI